MEFGCIFPPKSNKRQLYVTHSTSPIFHYISTRIFQAMFTFLPIYYIGIAQAFFVALLVGRKERKTCADKILIVWLSVIGIEMFYSLLNLTLLPGLPDLIIIPFAYGPFLYLYAQAIITDHTFSFKKYYLHFVPLAVLTLLALFWKGGKTLTSENLFGQGLTTYLSFTDYFLFMASMFGYWYVVLKRITLYQKKIAHHFSFQNTAIRLNWLKNIAWWIMGTFIASGIVYAVFVAKSIYPFNPIVIYHGGLLMFVFSISYYGIYQSSLKPITKSAHDNRKSDREYQDIEMKEFQHQIDKYMLENKPYLNRELSLQELADELETSVHKISWFLNHYQQRNFFNYINEYRVKEAKERILDPAYSRLTLLAIGYDSGFNSKSSFNALFKKYTGLTPSEFQKKHGR